MIYCIFLLYQGRTYNNHSGGKAYVLSSVPDKEVRINPGTTF